MVQVSLKWDIASDLKPIIINLVAPHRHNQ